MFDFAIIGMGIYGSALAYELTRRGYKVVAFDRFDPPHAQGSSHGQTRIYRRVPFEGAPYIELMSESLDAMTAFEKARGASFVMQTGGLDIAWADDARVKTITDFCGARNLPYEILEPSDLAARYPLFRAAEGMLAIHQPNSGYIRVEEMWADFIDQAKAQGLDMRPNTAIDKLEEDGQGVLIRSGDDITRARRAIVTAGAYVADLVPAMARAVTPLRQVITWFDAVDARIPVFTFKHNADARLYGTPSVDGRHVKIGWHNTGAHAVEANPGRESAPTAEEDAQMRAHMALVMPRLADAPMVVEKCIYTSTTDEHFIIDCAPGSENIHVLSCCSGHGFKFAAGITRLFADQLEGKPAPLLSSFVTLKP